MCHSLNAGRDYAEALALLSYMPPLNGSDHSGAKTGVNEKSDREIKHLAEIAHLDVRLFLS